MAELKLHITCDHEVFGDGSGDVECCMIRPGYRLMDLTERYGKRVLFFLDVCEYWAFKEVQDGQGFEDGSRPAERIREQMQDAVRRGHDVQLHFHPQWLHYEYLGNGEWRLDHSLWRLPDVDERWQKGGKEPLKELFRRGKETLEGMLQEADPNYKCKGFRAGAWCIQPERKVLDAMEANGFEWDSTVVPGMKLDEDLTRFDFSQAPSDLPEWGVGDDLCQPDPDGRLLEFPIHAVQVGGMKNASFALLKRFRGIPTKAKGCRGGAASRPKAGILGKLMGVFRPQVRMLNFSEGTTAEEMRYLWQRAEERYRHREGKVEVVMIGHTKNWGDEGELERFLREIEREDDRS